MIAVAPGVAAAALSVSPVRLRLSGSGNRTITITNTGEGAAAVDARAARFVLDRRGRPALARDHGVAKPWLSVVPRRVVLPPGRRGALTVSVAAPAGASPGDHPALVLLTTQARRAGGVAIRLRIGVVVYIRIPGRIVHRIVVGVPTVRRHLLEVPVANRGNVVERTRVRIALSRGGRVLLRLGPIDRMLLPHSRGVDHFRRPAGLRGLVIARVEAGVIRRTFRIRL